MSFALVDFRDEPLNITRVATSSPTLEVAVQGRPKAYLPGWQYEFRVARKAAAPIVQTRIEALTLYTSDPDRPTIVVAVRLEQVQRVRVAPAVLRLTDDTAAASSRSGMLYLDDIEGEPVLLGSVRVSHPCLQYTIERNGEITPRIKISCVDEPFRGGEGPLSVSVEILSPVREVVCSKVLLGRQ